MQGLKAGVFCWSRRRHFGTGSKENYVGAGAAPNADGSMDPYL